MEEYKPALDVPPIEKKCGLKRCIDFIMECARIARESNSDMRPITPYPFNKQLIDHLSDTNDVVEDFITTMNSYAVMQGTHIPTWDCRCRVKHTWKIPSPFWRYKHTYVKMYLGGRWWHVDVCADFMEPVINCFGENLIDDGVYISLDEPEYLDIIEDMPTSPLSKIKFRKNLRKECIAAGADLDGDSIRYACRQTDVRMDMTTITLEDYLEYVLKANRCDRKRLRKIGRT